MVTNLPPPRRRRFPIVSGSPTISANLVDDLAAGRPSQGRRYTDEVAAIDIAGLYVDTDTALDGRVAVTWTRCAVLGRRPWLVCPACGRRCAKLYELDRLACRLCSGLHHRSQSMQPHERARRRAQQLRMRLGGLPMNFARIPPKPRGMHGSTYMRIGMEISRLEEIVRTRLVSMLDASLDRLSP
jgi:hypothetical protein